jgi:hypothetical protein
MPRRYSPDAAPPCAGCLPGYIDRARHRVPFLSLPFTLFSPPLLPSLSPLFYLLFTAESIASRPRVFSGAGVASEGITAGGLYRRPVQCAGLTVWMWCGFLGVPSLTVGCVYVMWVVAMNLCECYVCDVLGCGDGLWK